MNVAETTLPNWLKRCAENMPQGSAISTPDGSWTFADLYQQSTQLGRQLATLGVQEGSRVAVLADTGLPFVPACMP